MTIEPVESWHLQGLSIAVTARYNRQAKFVSLAMQIINSPYAIEHIRHTIEWKNPIVIRVQNHQGPWCNQCGNMVKIPPVCIHVKHTITMSFNYTMSQSAAILETGVHVVF